MEEKVICASTNKNSKLKLIIAICLVAIAAVLFFMHYPKYSEALDNIDLYWRAYDSNKEAYELGSDLAVSPIEYNREHEDFYDSIHAQKSEAKTFINIAVVCTIMAVFLFYFWIYSGRTTITVTDKRIYGKAAFGKEVDLPLSSVGMIQKSGKKSIAIATSGGKVRFVNIKNRNEIYNAIQMLLAVK